MKSDWVKLKHSQVSDILEECQKTRDLVIVCRDGQLTCNAFIFSAVFRGFHRILESSGEDSTALVIPELCIQWLHEFLEAIYNQRSKISYNPAIKFLLNWTETDAIETETIKFDIHETNLVKQETSDYDGDIADDWIEDDLEEWQDPVRISVKGKVEDPDFEVNSDPDIELEDINLAERKKSNKTKNKAAFEHSGKGRKRKYERKIDRSFTLAVPTFPYLDLTCRVCDKTLISERSLYVHVHNYHGPHPERQCKHCDQVFCTPLSLDLHFKKVHAEKLPCVECGKLVLKGQMFTHMRTHEEVGHLNCDQCSKTFKYKKSLERHVLKEHDESFEAEGLKHSNPNREMERKCDEECKCGLQFSSLRAKLDHYRLVHLGYERCGKCNRITKEGLRHTCDPNYKQKIRRPTCKDCGQTFSSSGMLHNHRYTVHEVQSASCEFCGKVFRDQVKLKAHLRKVNHTGKTPCEICGVSVLNMDSHIKTAHVDDSLKKYQCTICGKGFVKKRKFDTHMNAVHYKIKPYKCRYGCDIAYGELGNRNSHEKKKHGALFEILRKDALGQTIPKKYNDDKYNR